MLDRAHELAADPFLEPDYYSDDADGHKVASVVTGDFVFSYWVDHAVKRVMITEIALAE
ncbi:MAG: hypothetical protein HZA93_01870 [Verrucomicrobia bacterium]|nr:hypothetical protein [Verrucomicrobiota bacterium]